jgi:acyl-coenzyme A synthetase/AMP-(fatty) acid ligase/predicted hotdog family 3-hydroxylacyl-ACP dehydratase
MIHLWRGFHHSDLRDLLAQAWEKNETVILIPQHIKDFSFMKTIARENLKFHGEWTDGLKNQFLDLAQTTQNPVWQKAILGVFTSGTSSGLARLVLYSKENVQASLQSIRQLFQQKRIEKIFCYPQPTHTFGLVLGYMQSILYKTELHFSVGPYSRNAHEKWLQVADLNTLTLGAPAHFNDLIQEVKSRGANVPASYSCIVGGARVSRHLWRQIQSVLKIESPSVGYGATEAAPGVTHLPPGVEPAEDGDIGFALQNVEIQITEEGVTFSGPNLCYSIFENQQFTYPQTMTLKDSVTLQKSKQPRYTFWGRTDSIINRGGIKISLEVVEAQISTQFGIPAVAVSLFDERLGDDLGLLLQADNKIEKANIQEFIKREWGFKIPDSSILFATIPLSPNGKLSRIDALKAILKQKDWTFPFPIEKLRGLLPHRGSAIWVDEVLDIQPRYGEISVHINETKNYISPLDGRNQIRETACIEWAAQSYGFVVAMNDILGMQKAEAASRAFIAEVKSAEFQHSQIANLRAGQKLIVKVRCTHDFGTVKVVDGQVLLGSDVLASLNMKLYCS